MEMTTTAPTTPSGGAPAPQVVAASAALFLPAGAAKRNPKGARDARTANKVRQIERAAEKHAAMFRHPPHAWASSLYMHMEREAIEEYLAHIAAKVIEENSRELWINPRPVLALIHKAQGAAGYDPPKHVIPRQRYIHDVLEACKTGDMSSPLYSEKIAALIERARQQTG